MLSRLHLAGFICAAALAPIGACILGQAVRPAPDSVLFRGVLTQVIPWAAGVRLVADVRPLREGITAGYPDSVRRMLNVPDTIGGNLRSARVRVLGALGLPVADTTLGQHCPGTMNVAPPGQVLDTSGCPRERMVRVAAGYPRSGQPHSLNGEDSLNVATALTAFVPVSITLFFPGAQSTTTYYYVFARRSAKWSFVERTPLMDIE